MRPQEEKGWWARNWGWFVPTACLGCFILPAACVGGCVWMGMSAIKSGVGIPYEASIEAARSHPAVIEALGEPIEMDWTGGNIRTQMTGRRNRATYPIRGPRGSGQLRIDVVDKDGEWRFDVLEVEIDGLADPIDLRDRVGRLPTGE